MENNIKKIIICEACKNSGQISKVFPCGETQTLIGYKPYYDEDGKYHNHNPNSTRTYYKCSNGHAWTDVKPYSCWCGWSGK